MASLDFFGMFDYTSADDDTYRYSSDEFSELIAGVTGTGVSANALNSFKTTASGLNLTVQSGVCFIKGRYGANHASKAMSVSSTTSTTTRYDRLVIELSIPNRRMELKIVKGTAASASPSVPALTQTDATYQMPLYLILVSGSTVTLTDQRPMTYSFAQIQTELQNRSLVGHGHALSEITGISLNTSASNIKMDGTASAGSGTAVAKANHVHPTDTSRAAASHTHAASDITSGTLGAARGGTGQTSLVNAANSLINALSTGSSAPKDNDYYVSQYANGGTETTTYHRRPMSALWTYIKGKADAVYAALSHTHALSDVTGISLNTTATNIKMNGTQSAGSGTSVAKANHVHPTDTSRAAASHNHALGDVTGISLNTTATNIKMNGTQSAGSGTAVALANHVHPVDTSRAAASHNHDSRYYTETEIDTKLANVLGNTTAATAAGTDLNTFKTAGVYPIWLTDASPAHSPVSGGGLHLLVVFTYGNYGVQLLFCSGANTSTTEAYCRTFYSGGSIQEWKALT